MASRYKGEVKISSKFIVMLSYLDYFLNCSSLLEGMALRTVKAELVTVNALRRIPTSPFLEMSP